MQRRWWCAVAAVHRQRRSPRPLTCQPTTRTRTFQGPVHASLEGRAQGPGYLPSEQRAGFCAQSVDTPKQEEAQKQPQDFVTGRCQPSSGTSTDLPAPVLSSACAGQTGPNLPEGNAGLDLHDCTVRLVSSPCSSATSNRVKPTNWPFEVWVNGAGSTARPGCTVAKTLSMDMRANDPAWLQA